MNLFNTKHLLLLAGLAAFACTSNPSSDEAEVGEAREVGQVDAETTYGVNTNESKIIWTGTKPTGHHDGTFAISGGDIKVNGNEVVGGTFTINMNDMEITDEDISDEDRQKLAGHLQSEDFFKVEEYPEAQFEIVSVEPHTGEVNNEDVEDEKYRLNNPTHKVTGNLTLRGTTKSVTFPARIETTDNGINAKARFNIDRTKWGVSYGDESKVSDKARDSFIYNTVNIGFDLVASN